MRITSGYSFKISTSFSTFIFLAISTFSSDDENDSAESGSDFFKTPQKENKNFEKKVEVADKSTMTDFI